MLYYIFLPKYGDIMRCKDTTCVLMSKNFHKNNLSKNNFVLPESPGLITVTECGIYHFPLYFKGWGK